MKKIKVLHMYADMLDLYGDSGNMEVIRYRCAKRGIECEVDTYSVDSAKPDFTSYDMIYIGGGADLEQQHISADLLKCREGIRAAYEGGTFLFLICGGYQLMGKYYRDADGNDIPGLELFDYYTVAPSSRRKRCIGNIVLRTEITGVPIEVVGFENHGGQTKNVTSPFGKVLAGNGNCFSSDTEGYMEKNVVATYLHGPLLSKNPKLCDHIINYVMTRKTGEKYSCEPINDKLEDECRQQLFERLLK